MPNKVVLKVTIVAALLSFMGGATVGYGQAAERNWKDRAEYDLYDAAMKATDGAQKLQHLNAWKEKYPASDYEDQRLIFFLDAYQKTNQPQKMYETGEAMVTMGREKLGTDLYFGALYTLTQLTMSMARTEPQFLEKGDKYAHSLMDTVKLREKPAAVSDADWKKQNTDIEVMSRTAIGWIAMTRKNNPAAEKEFHRLLEINPQNGQVTYWLATVILAQRDQTRTFEGMFYLARAANISGPLAMPQANRQEVGAFLKNNYVKFHGSEEGLDQFIATAMANNTMPAGLRIKSKAEIDAERENEQMAKDPKGYMWMTVKRALTAEDGEQYFVDNMKGRAVDFRGRVVGQSPTGRPDTISLAISSGSSEREVTLKVSEPFRYNAGQGTTLNFKGVATAFSKSPFNLTVELDPEQLSGWPPPPARQTGR